MQQLIFEIKKKEKAPTSKRAYWIDMTAKMIKMPFSVVLHKTMTWKTDWIEEMYLTCAKSENPARLWFGLVRKSKGLPKL